MVFNFTLLFEDWAREGIRAGIDRTLASLGAVEAMPTWVLESHDVTRLVTRYGGGSEGVRRARAAALLLLALPGAAYLYEGQELGLAEVELPDELRQDPIFLRSEGLRVGRDGCRVPVPWTREPPHFGFTSGKPWLPLPEGWGSCRSRPSKMTRSRCSLSTAPHSPSGRQARSPGARAHPARSSSSAPTSSAQSTSR